MALQVWLPLNGNLENRGLTKTTAVFTGTPTWDNGKIGQCAACNSTHHVVCDYDIVETRTFSVSFWLKIPSSIESAGYGQYVVAFPGKAGSSGATYIIDWTSYNNLKIYDSGHQIWWLAPGSNFSYNTWTHFTITHTYSTNTDAIISLYIDGALVSTHTRSTTSSITSGTLTLGGSIDDTYGPFYFNDVRIYDHCLSAAEVKEISKGLVLHYPLNDPYVEPTTNINNYIVQGISDTCYNGATRQYGYGSSTDMYKTTGIFQGKQCTKVYMGTEGLPAFPHVFFIPIHPVNGAYKTLSFDFFSTNQDCIRFYTYAGSATCQYSVNGSKYATYSEYQRIPINIGQWNHVILVLYGTSDQGDGWGYMQIGTGAHTSTTSDYWLFANVQIETKDHATPYTPSSRSENVIHDCSGYENHGYSIGSNIVTKSDSRRYSRCSALSDGTGINIGTTNGALSFITTGTITFWARYDTGSSYKMVLTNPANTSHWVAAWKYDSEGWYHGGAGTITSYCDGVQYSNPKRDGKWHFYAFTGVNLSTWTSGITNISNYGGSKSGGFNFHGDCSDYRVYNTILSQSDIQELYNTGAKICKNGTLMCYEVKES